MDGQDGEEPSLLDRAKAGDERAWYDLVQLYGPLVDWWVGQAGLTGPDREDVVQEVFLTVARRLTAFETRATGRFEGWLRTIATSRIADHGRRGSVLPVATAEGLHEVAARPDGGTAAGLPETADAERLELRLRPILDLVSTQFEPRTWEAFWRAVALEEPVASIAADLGVTPSAVRLAKSRVLRRIRALLA